MHADPSTIFAEFIWENISRTHVADRASSCADCGSAGHAGRSETAPGSGHCEGKASCGVARQYTGSAGKITNCQIGVFAAYVSRHGHAFIDRALDLPKGWTDDPARLKATYVPGDIGFSTKPQLAAEMIEFVVIQEAGLDGFWIDRALQNEGIESHVVDPASIATSRRRRRAKTDGIDGEALVRALLAYKRGEPRVCAMVKAPTPEEEDRRRLCRERKVLIGERVQHVNRVKGLLFSQGISGYERKLSGMCCLPHNKSQRRRRRRCCSISRASGRSSPPSSGRKGSSDTSTIDAKSLLMRA